MFTTIKILTEPQPGPKAHVMGQGFVSVCVTKKRSRPRMLLNFTGHPEDQYMSVVWSGGLPDGAAEDKKNRGIWAHTDATEPGHYLDCFHKAGFTILVPDF